MYNKVLIDKEALLTVQESIQIGRQILQRKQLAYQTKISKFETTHNMDTVTFSKLFNQGKLGDQKEWLKWDHYVSVINILEQKISILENLKYES
jgi:hypothetical protein